MNTTTNRIEDEVIYEHIAPLKMVLEGEIEDLETELFVSFGNMDNKEWTKKYNHLKLKKLELNKL